ncbi:Uncharacterised protein [Legionella busanensis]|uniref:Uncharacterized protein n=1 Tax=Legionella busanensis TaxID=190655 RepID=A0A378KDA9_9GAMM|nr:hypothetical protein [Legionella busanensis]STX81491.1 Uncharacterised protein [Legionella busanensis]
MHVVIRNLLAATVVYITHTAFALDAQSKNISLDTCLYKPEIQAERSAELQAIVVSDQEERENFEGKTEEEFVELLKNDLERRQRVGAIFAEGCLQSAQDFAAAALVFQHGDIPDHYYQTFLWAKRAVELGDASQKQLMALGIDRYLVHLGRKQLFGSQAFGEFKETLCYCLEPVEASFPDDLRQDYTGLTLQARFEWVASLNEGRSCGEPAECNHTLKESPKGTIPGFW